MTSQRQEAVENAWPTLSRWVTEALDSARGERGLGKVITDRPADTLADGLLRNCAIAADPETRSALHVTHVSRFTSSPSFRRVRLDLPMKPDGPGLEVLRQIAHESEEHQAAVVEWAESVVRAEVGLVWRALAVSAEPLDPEVGITVDEVDSVTITDGMYVEQRETHIHREQVTTGRRIDEATIGACRKRLGAGGRPLWLLTSDDPRTFTEAATKALTSGTHTVSWAPDGMFAPGQVVATAPGLLDVVLLRHSAPPLAWDYSSGGGIDLILEQLLAVEVIHGLKAVTFTRSD